MKNYQEFQAILLFSRCVIYTAVIPQVFCNTDENVYFMIHDVLRVKLTVYILFYTSRFYELMIRQQTAVFNKLIILKLLLIKINTSLHRQVLSLIFTKV